jgi:methyltransferase
MALTDSRVLYTLLVTAVAIERVAELAIARRNLGRALARGAVEAGGSDYPWMVALHGTFLAACLLEVWLLGRRWVPSLGTAMLSVLALSMAVRYWVIASLDGRWTTRAVYVPGDRLVARGPFRWMRHPNYAAVAAEMAAIPLVHGAWLTAIAYSAGNAFLLRRRIRAEEELIAHCAVRTEKADDRA